MQAAPMMAAPNAISQYTPTQLQVLGIVIPGRPVRTDFAPADASGLKYTLNLTCPGDLFPPLASIREIVFFVLPGINLPADHGVLCYVQLTAAPTPSMPTTEPPPSTGFELLGAITPDQPSSILQTGWSEKEELIELSNRGTPVIVTIAASIEPLVNIQNLGVSTDVNNHRGRLYVAQQIAYDLFHFMHSFDTGAGGQGNMVVPQNIFDRWFKRFENRFQRDPNFFMKKRDEY
ncbi:hypothetical protein ACA910_000788 [Epithemia clementina (nom. ined.)]